MKKLITEQGKSPLYYKIMELIEARIEAGEFKASEQIPSELQLCEEFNVSRITIRRAIDELVKKGLLEKKQGLGTYVSAPRINFFSIDLVSFTERMKHQGFNVKTVLLDFKVILPNNRVSEALQLPSNSYVMEIKRIRTIENQPITVETTYLPRSLFNEKVSLNFFETYLRQGNGLYSFLNNIGIEFSRAHQTFEPIILLKDEQEILQCNHNPAGMLIYRTTYSCDTPIEFVKVVHRGDRCKFEMNLEKKEF